MAFVEGDTRKEALRLAKKGKVDLIVFPTFFCPLAGKADCLTELVSVGEDAFVELIEGRPRRKEFAEARACRSN